MTAPPPADVSDAGELGDRLLALVLTAEALGWVAESVLRDRVRQLLDDVRAAEAQ